MIQTKIKRTNVPTKSDLPQAELVMQDENRSEDSVPEQPVVPTSVEKVESAPPTAIPKVNLGQRVWPD